MGYLNRDELIDTLASIGRHDRLPTRDVLLALDHISERCRTLDQIQQQLDEMEKLPAFRPQAN